MEKSIPFESPNSGLPGFVVKTQITCYKGFKPEDRFGTNAYLQANFIKDFLKMEIDGYKICDTLSFRWETSSPHAENFLWNVINYRVSYYQRRNYGYKLGFNTLIS